MSTNEWADLIDDGDVVTRTDHRTGEECQVRLKVYADDSMSPVEHMNDCGPDGAYGRLEWVRNERYSGRSCRPEWATGRARILDRESRECLWWEPPTDIAHADIPAQEREVRRVLSDGFYVVSVSLWTSCNAGHWHDVAAETIGGVDVDLASVDGRAYVAGLAAGLAAGLMSARKAGVK